MAKKDINEENKQEHIHNWYPNGLVEECCKNLYNGQLCNKIKISEEEYNRRADEWNNYYQLVLTTPSYLRFKKIREAYQTQDIETVKLLKKEAIASLNKSEYLSQPAFIDPNSPTNPYITPEETS